MKRILVLIAVLAFVNINLQAQDNVADIAHAFIKAVQTNSLAPIKPKFLTADAAYAILPKESAGMNNAQKKETYIDPLYKSFAENFNNIQSQIQAGNIDSKKIDLISYKIEPIDPNAPEAAGKTLLPQAMSLFFNYKKKEYVIPISVVEIEEQWYILEILFVTDLFKKE